MKQSEKPDSTAGLVATQTLGQANWTFSLFSSDKECFSYATVEYKIQQLSGKNFTQGFSSSSMIPMMPKFCQQLNKNRNFGKAEVLEGHNLRIDLMEAIRFATRRYHHLNLGYQPSHFSTYGPQNVSYPVQPPPMFSYATISLPIVPGDAICPFHCVI